MTPKNTLAFMISLITVVTGYSQIDNIGSGRAIEFNGSSSYIEINNSYSTINFPFTISAWINLSPTATAAPIFVTNDNNPTYRGFWFFVTATSIWCEFGDGTGGNNPNYRKGKLANINNISGKWTHVSAIVRSATNITLLVNGIDVGGSPSGESVLTMVSSYSTDKAKIGYFLSNNVYYYFKGFMDEVRLWSKALSVDEVRVGMCKPLTGNEVGLLGYWDFNEVSGNSINDKSSKLFNGQFLGFPKRVYSGAPIGNESVFLYPNSWNANSLSLKEGDEKLTIKNLSGSPEGAHIYVVRNIPSQVGGLDASRLVKPYFGVFLAGLDQNNFFDADYGFLGNASCQIRTRKDNSSQNWSVSDLPLSGILQNIELIKTDSKSNFDLGPDKLLCDKTDFMLSSGISNTSNIFLWNTGETTSSINVSASGKYWLQTSNQCGIVADTIVISFVKSPKPFSLGEDKEVCVVERTTLKPNIEGSNVSYLWQNGSTRDSLVATDFGTYNLTVKNECGQVFDEITFSKFTLDANSIPNVITPNGDEFNQVFKLDQRVVGLVSLLVINKWGKEVYFSSTYQNDWDGGNLSSGVYFFLIKGGCVNEIKSSISIIR